MLNWFPVFNSSVNRFEVWPEGALVEIEKLGY